MMETDNDALPMKMTRSVSTCKNRETLHLCFSLSTTEMFKSATRKIHHSSTIPFLAAGGLRPLQNLIAAEKAVIISYVTSNEII